MVHLFQKVLTMLFVSPDFKQIIELIAPHFGKDRIKLTRSNMLWFAEVTAK